jgi:hypothetical protein
MSTMSAREAKRVCPKCGRLRLPSAFVTRRRKYACARVCIFCKAKLRDAQGWNRPKNPNPEGERAYENEK